MRDQDSGDCVEVKRGLLRLCQQGSRAEARVRVVCRELEAWSIGDSAALAEVWGANASVVSALGKEKFRDPDRLGSPAQELRKLLPTWQKNSGARAVGGVTHPSRNRSGSFREFVRGVMLEVGHCVARTWDLTLGLAASGTTVTAPRGEPRAEVTLPGDGGALVVRCLPDASAPLVLRSDAAGEGRVFTEIADLCDALAEMKGRERS